MTTYDWQLTQPINTVIFDCDGTLSAMEGIDALAEQNGVGDAVKALTAAAMGQTGINAEIYTRRLDLVKPTREQVRALGELYYAERVPAADQVLQILQRLQKHIYIFSAGLYPAVASFGAKLGVPPAQVFAVPVEFAADGAYQHYDSDCPLIHKEGKRVLLAALQARHPGDVIYVGDGINDYVVYSMVARFVGYGGVYYRETLAALCQYYIKARSLAALLPLSLTITEVDGLLPAERALYDQGLRLLLQGEVLIR